MKRARIFLHCAIAILTIACPAFSAQAAERLTLFVASSLTEVASDIARLYEADSASDVTIVPAASSTLARQIAAGAPADVFLSADPQWADWLIDRQIGHGGEARTIAGNGLVVIAAGNSAKAADDIDDLLGSANGARIAVADPDHVPAGRYARQVLELTGQWASIAGRIVPAANVRDALRYVETGQVPIGIVYATDAKVGTVRVVALLPDPLPPIRYVALPLGESGRAQRFVDYMAGGSADPVLCRHGFRLPEGRSC